MQCMRSFRAVYLLKYLESVSGCGRTIRLLNSSLAVTACCLQLAAGLRSVRIHTILLADVGGSAVFAKQLCPAAVGQTVAFIHVEILLSEQEHELPHGAVFILCNKGPVLVATMSQHIDIIPK